VDSFLSGLHEVSLDDLVAAAQDDPADNSPAMNELVRRFEKRARFMAMTLTNRASLHDDLAQASLIGLIQAVRHHHRGRAGFVAYARLYMLGAAKRELMQWVGPVPESLSEPATWAAACAVAAPSQPVGVHSWGYGRTAEAVAALPEGHRALLTKHYIDDQSVTAIALNAGTSVPAVSKRLAKCHRAVAARLAA
jgi:RNA polymerase sigma factor (sigma-70 family)